MALKYEFIHPRKRFCPSANRNKTYKQRKIAIGRIRTANFTIVIIIVKHFIEGNYNQERFNNQTCHEKKIKESNNNNDDDNNNNNNNNNNNTARASAFLLMARRGAVSKRMLCLVKRVDVCTIPSLV